MLCEYGQKKKKEVLSNQLKIGNPGIKFYNSQYTKTSSEPCKTTTESIGDLSKCLTEYTATTQSFFCKRHGKRVSHNFTCLKQT